jgi:hypothetical protein
MKESTTSAAVVSVAIVEEAWQKVGASFERFWHRHGGGCGPAMWPGYGRAEGKAGHLWGKTKGKVGFHGGKVEIERPRVRARERRRGPLTEL